MNIETAFKETIELWAALAMSGRSKIEEIKNNSELSHMRFYFSWCPLCEYVNTFERVYGDNLDCSKCPVDWRNPLNMSKNDPEYLAYESSEFMLRVFNPFGAYCEWWQSSYAIWHHYLCSADAYDKAYGEGYAVKNRKYWAGQVAALATRQYEIWKEHP